MKRLIPFIFAIFFVFQYGHTQTIEGAKKYVLFEHYTNTSCGPCATQNPIFEKFFKEHTDVARHISFHVWWPGSGDPMYTPVQDEVKAMASYYGVTGVPDAYANGTSIGGPANANISMLDVNSSPIRLQTTEIDNGDGTRSVTVKIQTIRALEDGTYFLRVAANESEIHYNSAPGNNGEKDFINVFRTWIANNVPYTPAAIGESVEFNYDYTLDDSWDATKIYPLAYVVNKSTKEVLNSGTPNDAKIQLVANTKTINVASTSDTDNSYQLTINNSGTENSSVVISLSSEQPDDWGSSFSTGGETYDETATLDLAPGDNIVKLNVKAGTTPNISRYTISIHETGSEETQSVNYLIFHKVTDVVASSFFDGVDLAKPYLDGIGKNTINTPYGGVSSTELLKSFKLNALTDVKNIYLSIGWTFPALTDELTDYLSSFLDNGGNLMISGQDFGWDVMSGHDLANGTPKQKSFYTKYLHAKYKDDGTPSSNKMNIVTDDQIFGSLENGTNILISNVYGGNNLYPDHIAAADEKGHIFLKYKDNGGAAIWSQDKDYKTVYFAIGMEHITKSDAGKDLVKLTHDFFHGLITSTEFIDAQKNISLSNQPNPADEFTTISFENIKLSAHSKIVIHDIYGRDIYNQALSTNKLKINTSQFDAGVYFYNIVTDKGISHSHKMIITH